MTVNSQKSIMGFALVVVAALLGACGIDFSGLGGRATTQGSVGLSATDSAAVLGIAKGYADEASKSLAALRPLYDQASASAALAKLQADQASASLLAAQAALAAAQAAAQAAAAQATQASTSLAAIVGINASAPATLSLTLFLPASVQVGKSAKGIIFAPTNAANNGSGVWKLTATNNLGQKLEAPMPNGLAPLIEAELLAWPATGSGTVKFVLTGPNRQFALATWETTVTAAPAPAVTPTPDASASPAATQSASPTPAPTTTPGGGLNPVG